MKSYTIFQSAAHFPKHAQPISSGPFLQTFSVLQIFNTNIDKKNENYFKTFDNIDNKRKQISQKSD